MLPNCPRSNEKSSPQKILSSPALVRRRELLHRLGAGAFLAVPVFRLGFAEAGMAPPPRFVFFQIPGGSPAREGKLSYFNFDKQLASLAEVRQDVLVFKALRFMAAERNADEKHAAGMRGLLTGSSRGGQAPILTSVDQIIARQVGAATRFSSLHFGGIHSHEASAQARVSYTDGFAIPPIKDPVVMFRRLFGSVGQDPKDAATTLARKKSLLDYVRKQIGNIGSASGPQEKRVLDQHLTSLRELEKQLGGPGMAPVGRDSKTCEPLELPRITRDGVTAPAKEGEKDFVATSASGKSDVPTAAKLQLELLYQAINCDMTRLATFQWLASVDILCFFWWLGFTTNPGHHNIQHANAGAGPADEQFKKIQTWFTEQTASFIKKLKATPEAGGSLLDNTCVLVASEMSDGNHNPSPIPALIAGATNGLIKGGRVFDAKNAAHNDVLLAIAQFMGVPLKTIGDADLCSGPTVLT